MAASESIEVDFSGDTGTEQTSTITLSSTSLTPVQSTIAIANAQRASLAVGNLFSVRMRRIGDNASDTIPGRAVLLPGMVKNTRRVLRARTQIDGVRLSG